MFESQSVFKLIARKDHGINEPSDLKGKKIGVTKKTGSEFFLGKFLEWNSILLNDVILIDGQPSELATMLVNGSVDAVATFQPHVYKIAQQLGTNADIYEMQNGRNFYGLVYSKPSLTKERPDTVRRFVQSLVDAEQFVRDHPVEMQSFFSSEFQYSTHYIATVIPKVHFVISLNQSLLVGIEEEARWVIANNLTDKIVAPNFIDFIYTDALRKVKLDAVTLYH
jgi:NitT/TauT family transport system substrate-binding protein